MKAALHMMLERYVGKKFAFAMVALVGLLAVAESAVRHKLDTVAMSAIGVLVPLVTAYLAAQAHSDNPKYKVETPTQIPPASPPIPGATPNP